MSISIGKYTAGAAAADYADLAAALDDIDAGGLTGDMTILVVADYAVSTLLSKSINLRGFTLTITSAIDGKGKPGAMFAGSFGDRNGGLALDFTQSSAGGKFVVERQYMKRTGDFAAAFTALFKIQAGSNSVAVDLVILDSVFDGDGFLGSGLEVFEGGFAGEIYNCAFVGHDETGAKGLSIEHSIYDGSCEVENCVARGNAIGFKRDADVTGVSRNCLAFGNTIDFQDGGSVAADLAASDGNVSEDATAPTLFGGQFNLQDANVAAEITSTSLVSKDFMVPVDGSFLYSAGLPPAIEDNATSVEGSARPGSWNQFAVGMVEQRENLRLHWASQRKVTVDGDKIKVSSSSIQLCITQLAPGMDEVMLTAKADGGDIRVTTDRWGWDELPIEVAQWDPINGKCMIWIKPTAVVAGEDYSCYVWFGNANASHVPLNHDKGQWAVWEDYTMVYHCMEDPLVDLFAKDSSPGKHFGVWVDADAATHQDGLADAGAIGKSYRFRETTETSRLYMPPGDYINGKSFANTTAWVELLAATEGTMLFISENGDATTPRLEHSITASRVQKGEVLAPDGGTPEIVQAGQAITLSTPIFLGGSVRLDPAPEKLRWYQDGQFREEDPIGDAVDPFTNTDSDAAEVGVDDGVGYFYGKLQELWLNTVDRSDEFNETFFENLENGATFFKTPTFEAQDGARGIRFATDEGETYLDATDYFLTYATNAIGDVVMTLNAVWEAVGLDAAWGLSRRHAIEQRLRDLAKMVGRSGKLTLWPDPEQEYGRMTLSSVNANVTDNNTAIIYELTFDPGAAFNVARSLVFKGRRVNASDFFVQYSSTDRTVFKDVFRAAPIRIPSGPSAVTISITPLIAIVGAGDTALLTRKKQEEFLKEWAEDFVGEEGTLEIDGKDLGTAHLLDVQPANMTMPGRASVRMEFATGYGS